MKTGNKKMNVNEPAAGIPGSNHYLGEDEFPGGEAGMVLKFGEDYLSALYRKYEKAPSTPLSNYTRPLMDFLKSGIEELKVAYPGLPWTEHLENVKIDTLEIECIFKNKICFPGSFIRVWDGNSRIYGYIKAINPKSVNLNLRWHPIGRLYREVFPNLILTNLFLFLHYREKKFNSLAYPFQVKKINELNGTYRERKPGGFIQLLGRFMEYSYTGRPGDFIDDDKFEKIISLGKINPGNRDNTNMEVKNE